MKVLIVDNIPVMRRIMRRIMEFIGFKNCDVLEANDGNDAILQLKADYDIGLILADWYMPGMLGIELLKIVRSDERIKHIPFIMVTAALKREEVLEALKAGVTDYIAKPFTVEIVTNKIRKVLGDGAPRPTTDNS
jgi:two-component system, chemotaxis family, chemotaxis protein CheY